MKNSAHHILAELYASGIEVDLSNGGCDLQVPPRTLTHQQRAALKEHKAEIVALLHAAHYAAGQLMAAAMRVCDHWGDTAAAREQMRREVLSTPPHLRADLAQCLSRAYPSEAPRLSHSTQQVKQPSNQP